MSRLIRDWERSSSVRAPPPGGQVRPGPPGPTGMRAATPRLAIDVGAKSAANPRRRDGRTRRQCGGAVQSRASSGMATLVLVHGRCAAMVRASGQAAAAGAGTRSIPATPTGPAGRRHEVRTSPRLASEAPPAPPGDRRQLPGRARRWPPRRGSRRPRGPARGCAYRAPRWLRPPGHPYPGPSGGRTDPGRIPGPRSPTTVSTRRPQTLVVRPGFCGDDQNAVPSTGLTCQG